jgi:flagellar biosynthetic protein FliR
MESALQAFMTTSALAFMLTFVRMGTAIMIMPGVGDSFVSPQVRLGFAVALSFILFPLAMPYMPNPMPGTFMLFTLIVMEFVIGLLFGTIARIFMTAMDTAGMVMSISSGLGNAQIFNPQLAGQGSILGAFMSVTAAVVLFATDMHHLLFMGIMESYELFPIGAIPDTGSMADFTARALTKAFAAGVMIGAPFLVFTLILYAGMGVLSRLMPQIQVFMIVLPLQIYLSIVLLMITLSAGMFYWLAQFEEGMVFFLRQAGG